MGDLYDAFSSIPLIKVAYKFPFQILFLAINQTTLSAHDELANASGFALKTKPMLRI